MIADAVTISDHGGFNPRRVAVAGAQASWEISNVGAFSTFARIEHLRTAGLGGDLKGMWVDWVHPVLGAWGGVITERPLTDGVAEISAEGYAALLRPHVLTQWDQAPEGAPAGLARRALLSAMPLTIGGDPTFLAGSAFDESGEPATVTLGGESLLDDALPKLADAGMEWVVDADRVLTAGPRIGRDRSASVRLIEGRDIVTYQLADSEAGATPEQMLQVETLQETARRNQIGTLHLSTSPLWHEPEITIVPTPTGQLPSTTPLQCTVVNRFGAWGRCALGDTVRIIIESAGFSGRFRITSRGFDSVAGELTLAGEATPDAEAL